MRAMLGLALATEVPLYCGAVQQGLEAVAWQPLLADLTYAAQDDIPLLGAVNLSMSDLEFGTMAVQACDARASDADLTVQVSTLHVEVASFKYAYEQQRWPHASDAGLAKANVTLSLTLDVNLTALTDTVALKVEAVHVALAATKDPWVEDAVAWLVNHARPVLGAVVQHEVRGMLAKALQDVKKEGSCTFAAQLIHDVDYLHPQIDMREPEKVKVPVLGMVDVRINSTEIDAPPANITCGPWAFNGTDLQMEFSDLVLGMAFNWSYQKEHSHFWHNVGTGHAKASCGVAAKVSLVHPSSGSVEVSLASLDLKLHAAADAWMYDALLFVLRPLFRAAIKDFAGDLIRKELACLADPKCTHVPPALPADSETSPAMPTIVV